MQHNLGYFLILQVYLMPDFASISLIFVWLIEDTHRMHERACGEWQASAKCIGSSPPPTAWSSGRWKKYFSDGQIQHIHCVEKM